MENVILVCKCSLSAGSKFFHSKMYMNGEKYSNFIIGTHLFLLSRLAQHTDEHVNIGPEVPLRQQLPRQT